jgi:hypothetical protein
MAFDIQKPTLHIGEVAPLAPGFLDIVKWIEDHRTAAATIGGAVYFPVTTNPELREWELGEVKVATDPVDEPSDAIVTTPYLRRHFPAGYGTYGELKRVTEADFNTSLEGWVVSNLIAEADIVDISPGGDCPLVAAVGLLERALRRTNGQRVGYILAPTVVSPRMHEYVGGDNVTDAGNRVIYSVGADDTGAIDELPEDVTLYAFAQPYGTKEADYTSTRLGEDFDFELNDVFLTLEGTVSIIFDSTVQMFSCTTSAA